MTMSTDPDVEKLAEALRTDQEARDAVVDAIVDEMNVDPDTAEGQAAQSYRRDVLKALGVLGTGAAIGGGAHQAMTQPASASHGAGSVGAAGDPIDTAYVTSIDGDGDNVSVAPGFGDITADQINKVYVPGQGTHNTIQAAVDAITTATSGTSLGAVGLGEVKIPAKEGSNSEGYEETVDVTESAITLTGQGVNTRIAGSGDHAVDIQDTDVHLDNLWIDQVDSSGSYDAVNAADEAVFTRLDIDRAPRHGINIDNIEVQGSDIRILDFGLSGRGINFGANAQDCEFSTLNIRGKNNNLQFGIVTGDGSESIHIDSAHVENTNDNGIFWAADYGTLTAEVIDAGANGVKLGSSGDGNVMQLVVRNATDDALAVTGNASGNLIMGHFDGTVTLGTNTSNNVIVGRATGSVTDNGTGNDTSLLI